MHGLFGRILNDQSQEVRAKVISMYVILALFNIIVWGLTLAASTQYAFLLPTGLLAYTFGLRHAVDADHIAAIDNVTRKLMQEGKRPVSVGFFFSLGHSTIVILLSTGLAVAATAIQQNMPQLQEVGGLIGTIVSATFLFIIGFINLLVLIDLFKMFHHVTHGGEYNDATIDEFLAQRGLMNRFFRPLMRGIDSSWKMYPLGFLFGLGFDTASEIAILGISATAGGNGMPFLYVMLLPLLFTAGMTLVDTTDAVMMLGAYGWAFVKPIRKLYYNINITLVSVLIALVVGTLEVLSIVASKMGWSGGFWAWLGGDQTFEVMGYIIIGIFLASWLGSTLIYKLKGYDNIEVKVEG